MTMSMTGFGRAEANVNGRDISVEIKSVNHRYFEFSCRTSRGYNFLEDKLKSYVSSRVSRGKIDLFVSISANNEAEASVAVNHQLVSGYMKAMQEIGETYNIANDVTVSTIARYPDVFSIHKAPDDEKQVCDDVVSVLDTALDSFMNMRQAEGEKLKTDVLSRAKTILDIVSVIEERSPVTVKEYENRLKAKMLEVLEDKNIDEQRIVTEVAVFADKVAVAEETVRLRSHFDQLSKFLNADGPVGRKIDFIIQEMNREANTIGSKVQDATLAHMVVDIKSEIEKIREQIQNIE